MTGVDELRARLDEITARTTTAIRGAVQRDRDATAAAAAATTEFDRAIASDIENAVDQLLAEHDESAGSWEGPDLIDVGGDDEQPAEPRPGGGVRARQLEVDGDEAAERSWLE